MLLDFCGDASSVVASLATVKLLLNSVVSTKGAKFTTADIKDFFLCLDLAGVDEKYCTVASWHLVFTPCAKRPKSFAWVFTQISLSGPWMR